MGDKLKETEPVTPTVLGSSLGLFVPVEGKVTITLLS